MQHYACFVYCPYPYFLYEIAFLCVIRNVKLKTVAQRFLQKLVCSRFEGARLICCYGKAFETLGAE